MGWDFLNLLSSDTWAARGTTLAAYLNKITAGIQAWAGNVDASGYALANSAGVNFLAGEVPSTAHTVTAASWTGGVATLTIGAHNINPGLTGGSGGQQVTIAAVNPAGYNGVARVSAVTGTTISFPLAVNPGAYVSGGTVTVGASAPASGQAVIDQNFVLRIWNGTSFAFPSGSPGPQGPGYAASSTTSLMVATGSQTLATQSGLAYSPGAVVQLVSAGTPSATMTGVVTAYSTTSMTVAVTAVTGTGSHADWNINLAPGATGATGYAPQYLVGAGVPSSGTGNNSDMYINATTGDIYGPKTGGAWGGIVANLKGAQGTGLNFCGTWVSSGPPHAGTYAQGDSASYSSVLYVSLVNSNVGNIPSTSPTQWMSLATSSVAWGSITGTLSSQSDLNTALGGKMAAVAGSGLVRVASGTPALAAANTDYMAALGGGGMVKVAAGAPALATANDVTAPIYAGVATGTANALVGTTSPAIASYTKGCLYSIMAGLANTGAVTVNLGGGVVSLVKTQGGVATPLVANDILSGQLLVMAWDQTNMQLLSGLGNAAAVGGSWGQAVANPWFASPTTSRSAGNVYHNTLSVGLLVVCSWMGGTGIANVACDASSSPSTNVQQALSTGVNTTFVFIVPPGYYYELNGGGSGSNGPIWAEYRLPF